MSASRPSSRSASGSNRGVQSGERPGLAQRDRDGLSRTTLFGDEGVVERRRAPGDRLAVLGCFQAAANLRGLAGSQAGSRDLRRLVLAQLEPPGKLARVEFELGEGRPVRPPAIDGFGHGSSQRGVAAERVEQVALPALVEQPLLIVLAVDLDERPGHVRQSGRGHRLVVEPGGRSAADRDFPDGDQRLWDAVEERRDPGRLRPVPDERRVGPGTSGESEGVDQQALARAGLAGEDVQAGSELEPQPLDQGEVGDGDLEEPAGAHDGSSSTLCRNRSQNGWAPFGSTRRIGRSSARTSTTSPTAIGMSSRPSMLTSASWASTTRQRTICFGPTTTERIADR